MSRILLILAALAALRVAAPAQAAGADGGWPGRTGRYVFEITRDGTPIGTQSVEITASGDTITAVTESKVAVKILGVVVYRMHQVITETFAGRRMTTLHAETKDPDGLRVVDLARDGRDHWTGTLDRKPQSFDCDCMTSTMWQAASLATPRIIEASQAKLQSITVEDRGSETINLPEGSVEARHYAVKGGIVREVWYDAAGNLVAAQQVGRDGSLIRQNLIQDPAGALHPAPEAANP